MRIESAVGAEILVGQDRQDDEGEHRELEDGDQVLVRQARRHAVQLGLEIEQRRGGDRRHDGERGVAEPDGRAESVAEHQRHDRGRAGIVLRIGDDGGDHHRRHRQQADGQDPAAAAAFRDQGEQAAQHADQGEGAQTRLRLDAAFALDADQEPYRQADGESLHLLRRGGGEDVHVLIV